MLFVSVLSPVRFSIDMVLQARLWHERGQGQPCFPRNCHHPLFSDLVLARRSSSWHNGAGTALTAWAFLLVHIFFSRHWHKVCDYRRDCVGQST